MSTTAQRIDLSGFTGTVNWYRYTMMPQFTYTDGVKYLAEQAKAYWLLDAVFSWQLQPEVRGQEFQSWKLAVEDHKGILVCEDGNRNQVAMQRIAFTDFPLKEISLWLTDNVLLLPSEY